MKGFTLIEVVIYIGLFGVLIGGAVICAYQILQGGGHLQTMIAIQEEAAFLNGKLNWEIGQANSAAALPNGALMLEPGDVIIAPDSDRMTLTRGVFGAEVPLSAAAFVLSDITTTVTPASSTTPAYIQMHYTIAGMPFTLGRYLNQ